MTKPRTPPPSPPQTLRQYLAGPPAVSQRELAAAVGCNQSMISMLVRGKRVPSAALVRKLHAATGVPLKGLLGMKGGTVPLPRLRQRPRSRGSPAGGQATP